jgi:hypothetical protein
MKMLMIAGLAVLLTVVQGGVITGGKNAQCDNQKFSTCTDGFAKALGLPEMPTDATVIVKQIASIIGKEGLAGQQKICKALLNMKACLGDQYDSCISMAYLESIGEKPEDAGIFVTLASQENYMCTTGWDTFSKNWDCIADVSAKNYQKLAQCQTDYSKNMQKDPANACKYNQQMDDCYSAPYKAACVSAVYDLMCNSIKVGLVSVFPQCSITCSQ